MTNKKIDVVIIGASPAGIACADSLVNAGQVVLLLEASKQLGQGLNDNFEHLRRRIESRGGEILTNVAVVQLRPGLSGRGFHLKTKFNYIHAPSVVLATSQSTAQRLLLLPRWQKAGLYQIKHTNGSTEASMARGRKTAKTVLAGQQKANSSLAKLRVWPNKYLSKWPVPHQQLHKQSHQ